MATCYIQYPDGSLDPVQIPDGPDVFDGAIFAAALFAGDFKPEGTQKMEPQTLMGLPVVEKDFSKTLGPESGVAFGNLKEACARLVVPSCGPFARAVQDRYAQNDGERRAYWAGVIYGNAEKVFLGACHAAMFKPRAENFGECLEIVQAIAGLYRLQVRATDYSVDGKTVREIWIYKPHSFKVFGTWLQHPVNSQYWHYHRGRACGVPEHELDLQFHLRQGHDEVCDGLLKSSPAYRGE